MPYLMQERRDEIHNELLNDEVGGLNWAPKDAGDLNYLVSTFIDNYLIDHSVRYARINEMIGALECCKLELYRIIGSPYEDVKMQENGSAYTVAFDKEGY